MNLKIRIRRIPFRIAINAEAVQIQRIPEHWLFLMQLFFCLYILFIRLNLAVEGCLPEVIPLLLSNTLFKIHYDNHGKIQH
jgi:hypothetical protein